MTGTSTAATSAPLHVRLFAATDGVRGWLIAFLIVAAFGGGFGLTDLHDRSIAQDVARDGTWVTATDVEVFVDYESAKGGGWYEIDDVRARLPGSDGLVNLDAVSNVTTLPDDQDWDTGWQAPTSTTGYTEPLEVRVQFNGDGTVRQAVAKDDVDYWTVNNSDPEIGFGICGGFLALGGLALAFNVFRLRRLRRLRTSGDYTGATRSERRQARERAVTGARSAKAQSRR